MSKGLKITLIITGIAITGGAAFYFINKAIKRNKAYKTSVTPELASQVISVVNQNQS